MSGPAPSGLYELSFEELSDLVTAKGQAAFRARQLWDGLYRQTRRPEEMTDLPRELRAFFTEEVRPQLDLVAETRSRDSQTLKWLWRGGGNALVETVLMLYPGRATVCVSSQAGCAMGCSFCATGQGGFRRHLTTGEILEQVVEARRRAASVGRRLSNVVFMGMGEPLANYDRVWKSVERIHDGLGISARHLTISTVGVVPGIRRLSHEHLPVNLAVSLHAANDRLRNQLVPLNRRYPLAQLREACRQYLTAKNRRLSFEWALISGVNDRLADATELAEIAGSLGAHVNLIPLNPTPGYPVRGTPPAGVKAFRAELLQLGINATIRQNRGTDIDAACGQLAARKADPVPD